MDEDYGKTYGIDKLAELLAERGIEFCVKDETSLFFMDGSGNPHECWMAGAEENLVNALIVVTPEQLLSVPDLNGVITENEKLRHENEALRADAAHWKLGNCPACPNVADLQETLDENARLRELVRDMWFWSYCGHIDSEPQEKQMKHIDGVLDRMRKLGIEVGA